MTTPYGTDADGNPAYFEETTFLVLSNRVFAAVVAAAILIYRGMKERKGGERGEKGRKGRERRGRKKKRKRKEKREREDLAYFEETTFLVLSNRVFAAVVAAAILIYRGMEKERKREREKERKREREKGREREREKKKKKREKERRGEEREREEPRLLRRNHIFWYFPIAFSPL
jgi:hypothetical protein